MTQTFLIYRYLAPLTLSFPSYWAEELDVGEPASVKKLCSYKIFSVVLENFIGIEWL